MGGLHDISYTRHEITVLAYSNLLRSSGPLYFVDKCFWVRFATQEILLQTRSSQTFGAYVQARHPTHLEQIHCVPTPTRKENLVAVKLSQLGIERCLLEHSRIHVFSENERVGISAIRSCQVVFPLSDSHEHTRSTQRRIRQRCGQMHPAQAGPHHGGMRFALSTRSTTWYSLCLGPNCCRVLPDRTWKKRAGAGRTTQN
jgi:hypothetical protein